MVYLLCVEELEGDFVGAGSGAEPDLLVGDGEGGVAVDVELELLVLEFVVAPVPALCVLNLLFRHVNCGIMFN